MALGWLVWDGDRGAPAPAPQVPSGLALGPEVHAQVWLADPVSLDLSAARAWRVTGGADDPAKDVKAETRLSAAFGFGANTGAWRQPRRLRDRPRVAGHAGDPLGRAGALSGASGRRRPLRARRAQRPKDAPSSEMNCVAVASCDV
jgi:hypothetical protein